MDFTEEVVQYIRTAYGIEPECPWKKDPESMTFKVKETKKWFALIMPVSRKSLGEAGEGTIFIINVKSKPELISMLSQTKGYAAGFHMNKEHWLTIYLDGTVPKNQIFDLVDDSYRLLTDTPSRRIYEAVKKIPKGKVATYGQVAEMAGDRKMARAVGNALHKNPDPDTIPCYRVVNAKGELAGAFAFGGEAVQARLLEQDGIQVEHGRVDLERYGMQVN